MTKRTVAILLCVLCTHLLIGQGLPLKQSFEEAVSDNWNFTTNPAPFYISGTTPDIWDRISSSDYISGASDGTWFWESRDYDGGGTGTAYLTFDTVDLTSIDACTLTFDYYASGGLEEIDGIGYEIIYDNSTNWVDATSVEFEQDTSGTWITATIPISPDRNYLRFRLWAYTSAATEYVGFDNIQLQAGTVEVPEITIETPSDNSFYEHTSTNIILSGNATNIVGMITWSNSHNNAHGVITATPAWSIASITLEEGENEISVSATNATGVLVTDSVIIMRGLSFSPEALGSIAFVGFDTRGYSGNTFTDSISFVTLKELPAGTVIRFCDEEWNGIDFGTGEDDLVWSNSSAVAAGSVVIIAQCSTYEAISNNLGIIVSGDLDLAQSAEGIIAYYGDAQREPTAFLAAINSADENLNGTGLAYGQTAVSISASPLSQYYNGPRNGKEAWSEYLPLINNPANWSGTEGLTESWGDETAFSRRKAGGLMLVQ